MSTVYSKPWPCRKTRRGFTLLELLIVLVILVAMAALCWPTVYRLLRRGQLADAADTVRAELGRARIEAIESGQPRQFRFEPGGRRFEIAPRAVSIGGERGLFGQSGALDSVDESNRALTDGSVSDEVTLLELEDGVLFWADPLGDPIATNTLPADALSTDMLSDQSVPSGQAGAQGWSAPIVFYPNGRTLNAHFLLTDGQDYYIEITLRGLTGAAKAGPVTRLQDSSTETQLLETQTFEDPLEPTLSEGLP